LTGLVAAAPVAVASSEAKIGGRLHNTRLAIAPTRFREGGRRQQLAPKL